MQFRDYALPRSYISTTFCLPRNLGVCEYATAPVHWSVFTTPTWRGTLDINYVSNGPEYMCIYDVSGPKYRTGQVLQIAGDV